MKVCFFTLALVCASFSLTAQELRWAPDERLLALDASTWGAEETVSAAFVLENLDSSKQVYYREVLKRLFSEAKNTLGNLGTPEEKADRLLQFLHAQSYLKFYSASQTKLSVLLDTGGFNCVSSAILYGILADELGLQVSFVGTRDHAFCVVNLPTGKIDVETTTPLGFNPGVRREFTDQFGKLTGFAYVPPGKYTIRHYLDFKGLLGLLIQNLISDLQKKHDEITPMGLAWDRWYLEKSKDGEEFLLLTFKNLSAYRNINRQFAQGLNDLSRMTEILGKRPLFDTLKQTLINNQLVYLVQNKNWKDAYQVFNQEGNALGTLMDSWQRNLFIGESQDVYGRLGWEGLIEWLGQKSLATLPPWEIEILETYALKSLSDFMNRRLWTEGQNLLTNLPSELQARPRIIQGNKALEYNHTVEIHNTFADLMNKKNTKAAMEILNQGLKDFPESEILKKDAKALVP